MPWTEYATEGEQSRPIANAEGLDVCFLDLHDNLIASDAAGRDRCCWIDMDVGDDNDDEGDGWPCLAPAVVESKGHIGENFDRVHLPTTGVAGLTAGRIGFVGSLTVRLVFCVKCYGKYQRWLIFNEEVRTAYRLANPPADQPLAPEIERRIAVAIQAAYAEARRHEKETVAEITAAMNED